MSNLTILILVAVGMACILGGITLVTHLYNLNGIKAKLDILAKNESLRRNKEYREKLAEHRIKVQALETRRKTIETEYADWLLAEHEAVRNLKIIIPNELQPVYDRLATLGGEQPN